MLTETTITKLRKMRLSVMAYTLKDQMADPQFQNMAFEDRLGLLVDAEWNARISRIILTFQTEYILWFPLWMAVFCSMRRPSMSHRKLWGSSNRISASDRDYWNLPLERLLYSRICPSPVPYSTLIRSVRRPQKRNRLSSSK